MRFSMQHVVFVSIFLPAVLMGPARADDLAVCTGSRQAGDAAIIKACTHLLDAKQTRPDLKPNLLQLRGLAYFRGKDEVNAMADFKSCEKLATGVDQAPCFNLQAIVFLGQGKNDDVIAAEDKAIAVDPRYSEAYYEKGIALAFKRDPAAAKLAFSKTIALEPKRAEAFKARGDASFDLLDYDHAVSDYDAALKLAPDAPETYVFRAYANRARGRLMSADQDLEEALKLDPKLASAVFQRGRVEFENQDYRGAEADFSKAIALAPDSAGFYSGRGRALLAQNKVEEAKADFLKVIQVQPDHPEARAYLGMIKEETGDMAGALAEYKAAAAYVTTDYDLNNAVMLAKARLAALDPGKPGATKLASEPQTATTTAPAPGTSAQLAAQSPAPAADPAQAAATLGDCVIAANNGDVTACTEVLAAHPDKETAARTYSARAIGHLNAKEVDKALADYDSCVEAADPAFGAICLTSKAGTLQALKRYDEALAVIAKVQAMSPEDSATLNMQATILMQKGSPAEAIPVYDKLVTLDPKAITYVGRGDAKLLASTGGASGENIGIDAAIADYNKALEIEPKTAYILIHRAKAYHRGREDEEAAKSLVAASNLIAMPESQNSGGEILVELGDAWQETGHALEARDAFEKALKMEPKQVSALISHGLLMGQLGEDAKLAEDAAAFQAILAEGFADKSDFGLYDKSEASNAQRLLGLAWMKAGQADKSRAAFNACVELATGAAKSPCLADMASLSLAATAYGDAAKLADEAIEADPRNSLAALVRGQAAMAQGDELHALSYLETADRADLGGAALQVLLGRAYVYRGSGYYEFGIKAFTKALEIDPKLTEVYALRAFAHRANKDWDEALADCKLALAADPKDSATVMQSGLAHLGRKELQAALDDFEAAIKTAGASVPAWYYSRRGMALVALGQDAKAKEDFLRTLKDQPKNTVANYNLGLMLEAAGDKTGALAAYDAFEDVDGDPIIEDHAAAASAILDRSKQLRGLK